MLNCIKPLLFGEHTGVAVQSLTVRERILLHLFEHRRFAEEYSVPFDVTQSGIAEAVGIRVHHVTQYVKPLISQGLIEDKTSHVIGKPRRRKAYFLTHEGVQRAASLRSSVLDETVAYRTLADEVRKITLSEVHLEARRGSPLLELLGEIEASGEVAEVTAEPAEEPVDFSKGAPIVESFYGRSRDLDAIMRALKNAPVVVVTGIAGMGKTTLGARICDELRGSTSLFWRRVHPWDSALDLARGLATFLKALGRFELNRRLTGPENTSLSDLSAVLRQDLAALEALLVFDDVHNATEDAMTFFSMLQDDVRATGADPKVLLLSRTTPGFYSRREVTVDRVVVEYPLKGLEPAGCLSLLSDAGVGEHDSHILVKVSEGNPLFLKLLTSASPEAAMEIGLRNLETYIAEEIVPMLGEDERAVMQVASVVEVPVSSDALLVEGVGGTETVIGLRKKGLLEQADSGAVVAHDLVRHYFARGLSKDRRSTIASSLVPWMLQKAEKEGKERNFEIAITMIENAIAIDLDGPRKRRSLERLAYLHRFTGNTHAAVQRYRDALSLAQGTIEKARLHRILAEFLAGFKHLKETEEEIKRGLALLPAEPSREAALLLVTQAWLALYKANPESCLDIYDRVASWIRDLPEDPILRGKYSQLEAAIHTVFVSHWDPESALSSLGAAVRAWRGASEAVGKSARSEDDWAFIEDMRVATEIYLSWVLVQMGSLEIELGRPEEGHRHIDEAWSLVEESGHFAGRLRTIMMKAKVLASQGELREAESLYEESFRLSKKTDPRYRLLDHYLHFAHLYYWQGRVQESRESLEYWLKATKTLVGDYLTKGKRIEKLALAVHLSDLAGDLGQAQAYLDEAQELAEIPPGPRAQSHIQFASGVLLAAREHTDQADNSFQKATRYSPSLTPDFVELSRAWILLEYGRFLATVGRPSRSRRTLEEAQEAMLIVHRPMERAIEEAMKSIE